MLCSLRAVSGTHNAQFLATCPLLVELDRTARLSRVSTPSMPSTYTVNAAVLNLFWSDPLWFRQWRYVLFVLEHDEPMPYRTHAVFIQYRLLRG